MTWRDRAEQIPPFLCRFLATKRNGFALKTVRDIANEAGLSRSKIATLSLMTSWDKVAVRDVDAFTSACGVNFDTPGWHFEYLRKSKKVWMLHCNANQKKFVARLMNLKTNDRR